MSRHAPYLDVKETSTGVVVLAGSRAYKVKKAVSTPFLDFSEPSQREDALRRELALNRRICAEVYRGVTHVGDPLDHSREPILVMERMPDDRRLSALAATNGDIAYPLEQIATTLSEFHARAERSERISEQGRSSCVELRWNANLAELRQLCSGLVPPGRLDHVESMYKRYLRGRARLFDSRISTDRIVDGHGDLLADDIFVLPDGPKILDCLDFDDQLRCVDILDDSCFLAMDLEFLGHEDLARMFLASMVTKSSDQPPISLIDHYIAYRAIVRAKVDALRLQQGNSDSLAGLERHLILGENHLRSAQVRLCLVGGFPGTGKSTLSAALGEHTGATVISSDRVRRELVSSGALGGSADTYRSGLYSPDSVHTVYSEMLRRAHHRLSMGESVVLDATWARSRHRREAESLCTATSSTLISLSTSAPLPVAVQRIAMRTDTLSDATAATAVAIAQEHDPWPEAISIDTDTSIDASAASALDAWKNSINVG
ncbi:AAA family ATPase [Rhodococcus sp. (in: high G+C Gram-positive bacteria)]|uniref:bifunctional aminoglycoside phosphotransferase/ATP-binding protein n=1 Tax=Rhodococcus sp. TaxID=1831 RepID=UPI0025798DC1|nr:AAA family ATPase [Rhodococcus sp. (in: high G+C Gram-positive bacteria)]MBQ9057064.1 AAA family ATPase [Rhodococcus sp. (in: high G+C Gram-positive bacteria)]